MLLQFDKLTDLLRPGYHQFDHEQFGIEEPTMERIRLVEEQFGYHTAELLNEVFTTGDLSLISESALLNRLYALMAELVAPQLDNEKGYCIHLAARIVDSVMPPLLANAKRLKTGHDKLSLASLMHQPHGIA